MEQVQDTLEAGPSATIGPDPGIYHILALHPQSLKETQLTFIKLEVHLSSHFEERGLNIF